MPRGQDFFDHVDEEDRRARLAAAEARNDHAREQEERAAAARRESGRIFSQRTNDELIAWEYAAAGVEPLAVNGRGVPTVSLALLRWQGWTIEQVGERNVLIAPPARETKPRRRRQDYDQSS